MIKFCAECEPIPQPRPRLSKFGGVYFSKEIQEYKKKIKLAAISAMQGLEPMQGELKVNLKFYRKYKRTSRRFGDCDNLSKAVLDACNGIIYADDSQVVSCTASKHTSDRPRTEFEISAVK